jgi:PHD/YefM family antitoxin component YafN of YafNO toxin-antitoxin module
MINTMQYICDAAGQKIAVVVPIDLWQEIMSEKETAYLLSNPTMKERLLTAKNRQNGISLEEACEKLGI